MSRPSPFVVTLRAVAAAIAVAAAASAAAAAAYAFVVRPWHRRWGATAEEAARQFPGDDLVPAPKIDVTHAVTIRAPAAKVWPWLVQIGQGRGGFYSYESIENAMGADIHNTDRILPEHQNLKVGDTVPLAEGGFGIPVAVLEPQRALVLHGDTRKSESPVPGLKPGERLAVTWAWFLEPAGPDATRLIERFRMDFEVAGKSSLFYRVFLEPGAFVMERKMLLGIKARAEASSPPANEPG
jgi:hypothetical protein